MFNRRLFDPARSPRPVIGALVLPLLAGCPDDVDCSNKACPVGTKFDEYRAARDGFDLNIEHDPDTYDGQFAFRSFGEEECRYTCVAIQECPEWTFPVITADCFTCAAVVDGEVVGVECAG